MLSCTASLNAADFTPIGRTLFSLPSIPIVLDDIRCAGDETSILDCPKTTEQHNCLNWEDVILHCRGNGNSNRNLSVYYYRSIL